MRRRNPDASSPGIVVRDASDALPRITERVASRPRAGSGAMPDLPIWQQLRRIGGSLTPLQVSAIIRDADVGRMASLMDLANEARQKDGHLQATLATNEESIAGLPWELMLPEEDKRQDRKVCTFVEECLDALNLQRVFAHHAGGIFYGYAVSEILWVRQGGYLVPGAIDARAPRRFIFSPTTGRIAWYDAGASTTPFEGIDIRDAFPNQFLISQPRVTGDVPCREGLVRALMWAALFRNWALSDWLKLGEIAWKPWRTATYKQGTDDAVISDLADVLQTMTSTGVAVTPEDAPIKIEWPAASASASKGMHSELFAVLAAEISKAVLGQTETTQASASSGYAQAKVHNEVRKDLREARAKALADDINRDLIGPIVRLNFGPSARPPVFRFITEETADLATFALGVKALVDAGAGRFIPASWVNDQAGIPMPAEGEETLAPQAPAAGPNASPTPPPSPTDGSQEDPQAEVPDAEEAPAAAA